MRSLATTTLGALLLAIVPSCCVQAATIKASADVIELRGEIADGDGDRFGSLLTPATRVLRIRSAGGNIPAALAIARLVNQHGLDVDIDGLCASACAQMLLPAASHVRASDGTLVALHAAADGAARAARREGRLVAEEPGAARVLAELVAMQDAMDEFFSSVGVRKVAMDFMYELTSTSDVSVNVSPPENGKLHIKLAGARAPICRAWLVGPAQLRALGVRAEDWSPGGRLKAGLVLGLKASETYAGPIAAITPEDHGQDCRHFSRRVEEAPATLPAQAASAGQG